MAERFEIEADITRASTPPSRVYHDAGIHEAQRERIFARSWQVAGDAGRVRAPGHVLPFTLLEGCLDEPLVLARDQAGTLHCMSNVCTHRGALVVEGEGHTNTLRCRYHGRRFGLDGCMQFMPEFDGVAGFPSAADNLQQTAASRVGAAPVHVAGSGHAVRRLARPRAQPCRLAAA
jgi:choline monooxygenase